MPGSEVVQQLPPAASLSFCRERPARAINHMENKAVDLWPSVSQSAAEGPMVRRLSPVERDGFERLVPRHEGHGFPKHRAGCGRWRTKFA